MIATPIRASIVLCTFRRDRILVNTLSQLRSSAPPGIEILVVDQLAEHDSETTNYLEQCIHEKAIRYFNLDQAGLTHARNFGARQAKGQILLFCDDDVVFGENWAREHLEMYQDDSICAVAGQVLHEGESTRHAPGSFAHDKTFHGIGAIYGANFSIRRDTYWAIGGSDEQLGVHAYTEDTILAHKLIRAGLRISYCASASVLHLKAPSGGCRISDRTQPTAEWEKPFSKLYWIHLNPASSWRNWLFRMWEAARHGPLRRDLVIRFWMQPSAWAAFCASYVKAHHAALASRMSATKISDPDA